LIIKAATFP